MPGLKNGSSLFNAFEWDPSQHPTGIRVYGRLDGLPGFNLNDWWELKLQAGTTYTIQTRIPTSFNALLYLHDSTQAQLAVDNDSGDDGPPLSKITFSPATSGNYYIKVSNLFWASGTYTLECSPVPDMYWASWGGVGSRFDTQGPPPATVGISSRFSSNVDSGPATVGVASRFMSKVEARVAGVGSRFVAHHQARTGVFSRFVAWDLRLASVMARLSSREVVFAKTSARLGVREQVFSALGSRHDVLVLPGWHLFARNTVTSIETYLGWIPSDATPKKLTDIPLPDGTYEIEVRPSQFFWQACRGRKVVTMVATGGSIKVGLPAIQDLASSISDGVTTITWKVAQVQAGDFQFGLWFSPTSPVDTFGAPDQVVGYYPGVGDYQAIRAQYVTEYIAVSAWTATDKGPVFEVLLPWNPASVGSPSDQNARL